MNVKLGLGIGLVAVASILAVYWFIFKGEPDYEISFTGPTKIMSEPVPFGWGNENTHSKVLETVDLGATAIVKGEWAAKEVMVYKIQTKTVPVGYIFAGDSFKKSISK